MDAELTTGGCGVGKNSAGWVTRLFLNFKTLIQNFVSLKIVHTFCGAPWRVTWSYARDCSTGQTAHSLPISNPIQCEQTVPYL